VNFIITRLWREFVSDTADPAQVAPIAERYRMSHDDTKVAPRGLYLCNAFWDEENRGTLAKPPAEFVVGALLEFDNRYDNTAPFAGEMRTLGPPSVKVGPVARAGSTVRRCWLASSLPSSFFALQRPPLHSTHSSRHD
jgi:uncharacterized protein (DUF1800 family)